MKLQNFIKSNHKNNNNGFYVHAPQIQCKSLKQIKRIVNCICRLLVILQ